MIIILYNYSDYGMIVIVDFHSLPFVNYHTSHGAYILHAQCEVLGRVVSKYAS